MAIPPTEKESTLADQPSLAQTGWLLEAQGTQCLLLTNTHKLHSKLQHFPLDLDIQYIYISNSIQLLKTQIGTYNTKPIPHGNDHSSNLSN